MADIGSINFITLRKTGVLLVVLICFAIISVYIASERQRLLFYDPDITVISHGTLQTPKQRRLVMIDNEMRQDEIPAPETQEYISSEIKFISTSNSVPVSSQSTSFGSSTKFTARSSLSLEKGSSAASLDQSRVTNGINGLNNSSIVSRLMQIIKKRQNKNFNDISFSNVTQDFNPVVIESKTALVKTRAGVATDYKTLLNESEENVATIEEVHLERINRIKDTCSRKELFLNTMYKGQTKTVFYDSLNYNFTYCKVPKSGSTFWTRTFAVLRHGVEYGERMFKLARSQVHQTMGDFVKSFSYVKEEKSRTVIVSRNPYSRLFSAFIDKSFLLLMKYLNFQIRKISGEDSKSNTSCPIDVTFQEFLDWIISEAKGGRPLNRHWSPIFALCFPCDINSFILVKQETFANDVEFALEQVGVENEKLDYITQALHDHRAELSLPGIIDTAFITAKNDVTRTCLGYLKYANRIWISLQIQGFIDKQNNFPVEKFDRTNFSNSTYFTEIVFKTLRDFPMTSLRSREQRNLYLNEAYKSITLETVQEIQGLYNQDFELFGYSKLPPTESVDK